MALRDTIKEFRQYLDNKESYLDKNHKNIADKIELHWGYPEFYDFIKSLLVVEKDRHRSGLPVDAIKEINILENLHEKLFPNSRSKSTNRYLNQR